ncbi:MAG TPA: gluconate:H+ symporter [Caulobacteraceae bacterium]|nr:gluconate:H+ symporter [Caulobacteraceae bacterium]
MLILLLIGLGGIALLLALVLGFKLQPFVALLLVSIVVALAAGLPVKDLAKTVEEGLGASLGHIALIIALGAMIGRIIDESGGAEALARAMMARFGDRRLPVAMTVVGFLIGIPVFFEVGVIMLMPLAYGVARRTGGRLLPVALPMCVALLIVHALLPPHPGAVAIAGLLHADIGRMLMFGLPIAVFAALVASPVAARLTRGQFAMTEDIQAQMADEPAVSAGQGPPPPPAGVIGLLIVLPIVLILASTAASLFLPPTSPLLPAFTFLGIPFVALLLDVLLCAYVLGVRRGWSRERVGHVLSAAIPGVSIVILITGGGAIFAKVLVTTGIGGAVADMLHATGLPLLLLGFLLTLLIRAVQGPTTVALITVGGIIGPYAARAGLDANHIALLCLAMGSGGIAVSHVNDAGFWIVTRLCGLTVRDGLRTWTVLTTLAGFAGFAATWALWGMV